MTSYSQALDRVREQTEKNYAAREEGGGVLQEILGGLLGELNADLDPANVDKPLSMPGRLLNSILPVKEMQIKQAAEAQARVTQAQFTAEAGIRQQGFAEQLDQKMASDVALNAANAQQILKENLPTLPVDKESDKAFITNAVKNIPSLAKTIVQRDSKNRQRLFQVFEQGVQVPVKAGELVYTDKDTGQQLYAASDSKAINLNYQHSRLGKTFRENLRKAGFDPAEMRDLSFEAREKLFSNKDFKNVLKETVDVVTPELLQTHEIYQAALIERTAKINEVLKSRYTAISGDIIYYERERAKAVVEANAKGQDSRYAAPVTAIDKILDGLRDKRLTIQLDGRFQSKVRSVVHRKAFALSMLNKQEISPATAEININTAIQLAMKDEELNKYKEQLRFYYDSVTDKSGTAGASSVAPAKPTIAAGHGQVPSSATNSVSPPLPNPKKTEVP
tara:strand:+ start:958 stop:2304 length:1347 start_codon:yes stop_codon:yes gene_type:complete